MLARLRGDEQKQEDIEVSSDTEQYAFIDRGDDYYGSQLFELVDELKAKGIKVEADESEDDIDVLERALDDPACAAIVTIRREKRPRILNARIDAELDHQIALHCKNRPLHRLILNSCGLENEQISQELSSSDWKIANNLEDLLGNLQINNFRYNSYSKE